MNSTETVDKRVSWGNQVHMSDWDGSKKNLLKAWSGAEWKLGLCLSSRMEQDQVGRSERMSEWVNEWISNPSINPSRNKSTHQTTRQSINQCIHHVNSPSSNQINQRIKQFFTRSGKNNASERLYLESPAASFFQALTLCQSLFFFSVIDFLGSLCRPKTSFQVLTDIWNPIKMNSKWTNQSSLAWKSAWVCFMYNALRMIFSIISTISATSTYGCFQK